MKCLRASLILGLCSLLSSVVGCGGDDEGFDPTESEYSRAIREKVRADMEIERRQRAGRRLSSLYESLEKQPYAYKLYEPTAAELAALAASKNDPSVTGLDRGKTIYLQKCASCHGERGAGDGPTAVSLVPKPAKHSDGHYMNVLSNDYLFKVIKEGGSAVGKSAMMAPWGTSLSDKEIRDLVEFVRSLAEPSYPGGAS